MLRKVSCFHKNRYAITELLLLQGYPLNSKITTEKIHSNTFWNIKHHTIPNKLKICLDDHLEQKSVEYLSGSNSNHVFICLDTALSDNQKVLLSETLTVKTI